MERSANTNSYYGDIISRLLYRQMAVNDWLPLTWKTWENFWLSNSLKDGCVKMGFSENRHSLCPEWLDSAPIRQLMFSFAFTSLKKKRPMLNNLLIVINLSSGYLPPIFWIVHLQVHRLSLAVWLIVSMIMSRPRNSSKFFMFSIENLIFFSCDCSFNSYDIASHL